MSRASALVAVAAVCAVAWRQPASTSEPRDVVEVVGEVSGFVELPRGSRAHDAVHALGGESTMGQHRVRDGHRIRLLADGRVRVESGDALLFGRRLDLNRADRQGLMALPGVGARKAQAIQAGRPYAAEVHVVRARGVGTRAVGELAPLVHTRHAPEPVIAPPTNINTADAAALADLSGLGPVLSRRVVADRSEGGPFEDARDLQRVHGIGPSLASRLAQQVVFE